MKHFSSLFLPATEFNTAKFSVRWAVVLMLLLLLLVPGQGRAQSYGSLPPSISGFSPTSGSTGTSLVITGAELTNTFRVQFTGAGGYPIFVYAPGFVVNSATQITVRVPAGALSGPVIVSAYTTDIHGATGLESATSATSFVTDNYLIGTGGLTVCSGTIYDDGGATASPNWNHDYSTTISPATAGSKVRLSFTEFDIDLVDARLYLYDGPNFNAPLIGQYAGLNSPGVVTATNAAGQLTIRYASAYGPYSDDRPGFAANISCVAGVPTISSFTPTNGAAGTSVVITGVNFSGTTAVAFNGVAASGVVVNSSTQITVPVPAGATSGPITVTNAIGTGRSASSFILQPLTISSFTPTSGTGGTSVVITGLHLTGASAVRFNGILAPSVTVDSDTQLTVQVPTGNTTGPISVTTPSGTGASTTNFTVLPLSISSFTPTTGAAGTSVVITGVNFSGTTAVAFNGTAASGYSVNAAGTQITVSVPAGATTGPISVTNALGTGSSATSFILAPPVISSFTPANGLVGASVVITGTSFLQASAVRFNGLAASGFVVNSSTQITVSVPVGATTGPISVTTPSGTGTSASSFTVLAPVISSFTPTSGLTGTSVVITGLNFTGASAVRFNGLAASGYSVNADGTQITVNVPTAATTGPLSVTTPTGTFTSTTNFTVPEPTISSFSPTSGTSGTSVVITGANFTGTTAVRFNGTAAAGFVVNSDTQLTVNVPAGASTGPISVTTGATATSVTNFVTDNYWLSPAALTVCSGTLYDANGPNNVTAQDNMTTLSPATAGAMVRLNFTQFRLDTSTGTLYIYDGPSANAPLLGQYKAVATPGIVTATNATGQLTLRLVSGTPTASQPGFAATISCVVGVPIISNFTPTSGGQSVSVTITGTNFIGTTAVRFNGALASGFVVDSDTQITVPVPAGATNGPISVTNGIGTGTSASSFTVLAPAISSFTPTSGKQNVSVTITGTNFTGTTAVAFNGALAPGFVVNSDTQITAIVSAGAISGPIAVTNGVGTGTSASSFTVLTPTISSFTPSSGTGGTSVVITGANFTGITAVAFNGTAAASFVVDSDTQITAIVSAGTISGFITVTNGVGTGTSASNFVTGDSQVPLLTSVSPARNLPTASLGANVVLTFSQPIAASTAGNMRVFGSQSGGQLVRGGNATASGNTITVDPARPFAPGERVMVTVPATVQSTADYSTVARVHEFTAETALAPATFLEPAASYAMQAQSRNVAVGDLNGDGVLDVVTGDFYGGTGTGSAVVRLGLGNGQLGPPVENIYANYPTAITLGDVDGDGDLDLVTSGATDPYGNAQNQVYRRLNNGSGSFGAPQATQVNTRPTHTVLGDLDGDGDLDMLTAATQATLSFYANGTFSQNPNYIATRTTTGAFSTAVDVALGDVDGDGDLDALIANGSMVSVRLNNGLGVFSGTYDVQMSKAMTKLVVGDVDGDGDLDLVTSSSATSTVSVRLNYGNGTFGGGADYPLVFAPNTLALGDVDGDGDLDLVTAGDNPSLGSAVVGQAVVRLNNGSGTFSGGSNIATGGSRPYVALGDMDGDGTLDLLTSHEGNSRGSCFGCNIGDMAYDYAELFIRFNTATPPTVAGFSPQSGPAGTLVTITGTSLSAVRGVRFGGSSELAPITAQSANSVTVQVPVGAATGPLTLTTSKGVVVTTATAFTYTPRLTGLLATLSPAGPLEVCQPRTLTASAASPSFDVGVGFESGVTGIVVQPDGKLLVNGPFLTYKTTSAKRLIRLNADGSIDQAFDTGMGFDNTVSATALQPDGKVLVGGLFTTYKGDAARNLVRLNADGSIDRAFDIGTGFDNTVQSIVVQPDGKVLVGGQFTTYQGSSAVRLIRLNPDGSRDPSFSTGTTGFNDIVQSLVVQPDGKVLVAGDFTSYRDALVGHIIRLNSDGSPDTDFVTNMGSGFNGRVSRIAVQVDGKVLVSGQFTLYNSTVQNRITRLNADGTRDLSFISNNGFTNSSITNFFVRVVTVQSDGNLLVGGNFTAYNGVAAGRLIRLLPNGSANDAPTPVSGATFTFSPGNTTTNPLVTSTAGSYTAVATLDGVTSPASNAVTLVDCGALTTVTSIVRASADPTNASSVEYTVTFGASVTGLLASNFDVVKSGGIAAAVTGISGSGTTYTVTVSTGTTGSGTLTLRLANAGGISPAIGNALPFAGESYTIDRPVGPSTPLTVSSSTRQSPTAATTNATSLVYRVTFSEAVTGVVPGSFTLATSGATTGTVAGVTAVNGSTYDVTVTGVSGTGTARLDVKSSGSGIRNADGNEPSGGYTAGETYAIDQTAPIVTSFSGPVASGNITSTTPFDFLVDFSEDVTGFSAAGITVTNGSVTSGPIDNGAGMYAFTVTPTTAGTATTVQIAANAAQDAAGNGSTAAAPFVLTYTVPLLPPTISSFTPTSGVAGTSVVITGASFIGVTGVAFNGTNAAGFVVNSSTQLTVNVPNGATTGPVTVTNSSGTGTSASEFTILFAPVVATTADATMATEQVATAVDAGLSVIDADNPTLASATVRISGGFVSIEDVLSFTPAGNITGVYDGATGVLSLTSAVPQASLATWEAVLRSVSYLNTSDTPNTADRTVSLGVNDGALNSTAVTKLVHVQAVNDAPGTISDIASAANAVAENARAGTLVGVTALATDPDSPVLTYSLSDDAGGRFAIDANLGEVRVANGALLNYEASASHTITVQVSDGSLTSSATFSIQVTDVNEAPSVANQVFSAPEYSATGTAVGTVGATDPDAGQTLSYSITAGNTNGAFALDGNLLKVATPAALDFVTNPSFTLTVRVQDSGSPALASTATVTVNLTEDPCLAPTNVAFGSITTTSVSVSFTGNATAKAGYIVSYATAGGVPRTVSSSASPVLLTGLLPNTSYQVTVSSACSPIRTATVSSLSFTTLCETPALPAIANRTVNADAEQCSALVAFTAAVSGVPTPVVSFTLGGSPIVSPYKFPVGTSMVTATATNCGGTTTQTFTVTVEDHQNPSFVTSPAALSVSTDAGLCSATVILSKPLATDNCAAPNVSGVRSDGLALSAPYPQGTTTVTWTATDGSSNTATVTQRVEVTDRENPVVLTKPLTLQLDATGQATLLASSIDGGSTDNCGIVTRSVSPSTFGCSDIGPNTVMLTVTDGNGNVASAPATVTVQDRVAPTVLTQNLTVQLNASGTASITAAQINNGSADACGIRSLSLSTTSFGCANVGPNTVTLTVTDVNGNTNSKAAVVTVEDRVAPAVVTQNITVQLDASGNASTSAGAVDNGSTDACGIRARSLSKTTFSCSDLGPNTVTLTVTDVNGNANATTAVVTVLDGLNPSASCQSIDVFLDPNGSVSITPAQINNGSSDNCTKGTDLGLALDASTFTAARSTPYPVTLTVTDGSGNHDACNATVLVKKRPTTLVYSGNVSGQYSDRVSLTAQLSDYLTGRPLANKSVTWTLGSQTASATTDATGTATATLVLTQDPRQTYSVATAFAGDGTYSSASDADAFTLQQEDARLTFTGGLFASTTSISTGAATVTLSATVRDITALSSTLVTSPDYDQDYDAWPGNITLSTVSFMVYDAVTGAYEAGPFAATLGLVTPGDAKTATATYAWAANIGASNSRQFTVRTLVNGYYVRNSSVDDVVLTVSKPLDDFVTGGGYIVLARSAGAYAGTSGTRTNFGFNIKYNKSNKNLQGAVSVLVRRLDAANVLHTYRVKGNVMQTLAVQSGSAGTGAATFTGKASILDITDPLKPKDVGGNATLKLDMTDVGTSTISSDQLGITVWDGLGATWFASDWDGRQTVQKSLAGGNIVIRGGAFSRTTTDPGASAAAPVATAPLLSFEAYPNPAKSQATIRFQLADAAPVRLDVYNALGALVKTLYEGPTSANEWQSVVLSTAELGSGVYLCRLSHGTHVEQLRLIVEK